MRTKRLLTMFCLVSILVLLPVWGMSPSWADNIHRENKVPGTVESKAHPMNSLRKQGFEVKRGYFRLFTEEDCPYAYEEMLSCYGNNPAAPYVFFFSPSLAGRVCRSCDRPCVWT